MKRMDKTYNPQQIEQQWYKSWDKANHFSPTGFDQSYCIMLPPPNVTGYLHMGHGFQLTLMDTLIRYHRMKGKKTLWQAGTDHAGISTQIVVERRLEAQKKTRESLGRKAFVEEVWQWKKSSGSKITDQLKRMGCSIDWSRERFTLDAGLSQAVQKVFIQLFEEGLIYRGKSLVNWDPKLQTAISDLEVISEEEDGFLWYIRYPILESDQYITVATTRPETMLGDVAIAVHPEDERYQHLIGEQVRVPLTDRLIPVIGDEMVEPDFANGCVKITPAHDFNDYEVGKNHRLDSINIFTKNACLNENVPKKYRGLERNTAREKIVADLTKLGLLEKTKQHRMKIPRGEKSGVIIEPYLTDQWFIKIAPLAEPAIKAVEDKEIKFIPENWAKIYFQWMLNIEDWCISRQLWWGHRIPAWYDEKGRYYVGKNEQEVREKHKLGARIKLKQDEDVLDTWFSAALWPFSTLGWPEKTPDFKTFYPTNVLITGFDIIFFWVARMIMMALKFTGKIPFKEVYITGLIRDAEGKKMSKSKGNVLDPLDIIDGIDAESLITKRTKDLMLGSQKQAIVASTEASYPDGIPACGTDALRFTFCALANTGRDIRFDLSRIEGYRNFCNKLWNAARYVLMNAKDESDLGDGPIQFSLGERWILSRLQDVITNCHKYFQCYRFDLIANTLYEFIWHEYCDWYLELSKFILYTEHKAAVYQRGTHYILIKVLEVALRLLHPIMPFITEEIWQKIAGFVGKTSDTIMLEPYPEVEEQFIDQQAEEDMRWMQAIITSIRNVRGEINIAPNKRLSVLLRKGDARDQQKVKQYENYIITLAKLDSISWLTLEDEIPAATTTIVGRMEILIPLSDLINKGSEINRLNKEVDKLSIQLTRCEKKLNNPDFIAKAPDHIIKKQKTIHIELKSTIDQLSLQLEQLKQM